MSAKEKTIFHVDLNAFYASVEMILDPYLKRRVFAVGGSRFYFNGGVITTASYKARKYGIRSGMTINDALKKYPRLIVVPNNHAAYKKYSNIFINYLKTFTNQVLQASIDEAYLDVTDLVKDKDPYELAVFIQQQLYKEHQLPTSIGIGPTLFLAKMGSDYKKPMGITIVNKEDIKEKLYHLPVNRVFGIGKKTTERLLEINIKTIEQLMDYNNKNQIIETIGDNAYYSFQLDLLGQSSNYVDINKYAVPKSISNETTLSANIDIIDALYEILNELFEETYTRLIKEKLLCKNVFVKIRYDNFTTTTKTTTLADYEKDYHSLFYAIRDLFDAYYNGKPVRLIGLGFGGIIKEENFQEDRNLFNYEKLDKKRTQWEFYSKISKGVNWETIVQVSFFS